jgi:hypothetical protein
MDILELLEDKEGLKKALVLALENCEKSHKMLSASRESIDDNIDTDVGKVLLKSGRGEEALRAMFKSKMKGKKL